jgi:hypothetical protein
MGRRDRLLPCLSNFGGDAGNQIIRKYFHDSSTITRALDGANFVSHVCKRPSQPLSSALDHGGEGLALFEIKSASSRSAGRYRFLACEKEEAGQHELPYPDLAYVMPMGLLARN